MFSGYTLLKEFNRKTTLKWPKRDDGVILERPLSVGYPNSLRYEQNIFGISGAEKRCAHVTGFKMLTSVVKRRPKTRKTKQESCYDNQFTVPECLCCVLLYCSSIY